MKSCIEVTRLRSKIPCKTQTAKSDMKHEMSRDKVSIHHETTNNTIQPSILTKKTTHNS